MDISRKQFYVTLFSNASKEMFPDNTLTAFTIHLAQPIDLGSSDAWELGLSEIYYKAPNRQIMKGGAVLDFFSSTKVLIYCDLITPQFLGKENVRLLRTIICPTQSGNHVFQNVYHLPVKKTLFQDICIEPLAADGGAAAFEDSIIPTNVVLHFRRI